MKELGHNVQADSAVAHERRLITLEPGCSQQRRTWFPVVGSASCVDKY
jgi:hypothetical protein